MRRYAPALVVALCAFFALLGCQFAIRLAIVVLVAAVLLQSRELWRHYRRLHRG